jgi:hypothetical protein
VRRDRRFPVVLSKRERQALRQLAQAEALSGAAVLRRLIIREAKRQGLWPGVRGETVLPPSETVATVQSNEEASSV